MPEESCVFEVCYSTFFVYTSVNALATILSTRPLARMSWRMGHSLHTRPQHTTRHIHGIKTMQDLLFSAFLYTAAFCFICWFRYNPNPSGALVVAKSDKWEAISSDETEEVDTSVLLPLESTERPTLIVKEAQRELYDLEPQRQCNDLVSDLWVLTHLESKSSTDTKPDNQIADTDTPKPQPIDSINIGKLPLRVCRKIASELTSLSKSLAISQKVNGKDKPVSQLRAEIKNCLVKDPTTVTEVIVQYAAPTPPLPVSENRVS